MEILLSSLLSLSLALSLHLLTRFDLQFDQIDLETCMTFAAYCGIALTNAQHYQGQQAAERRLKVALDVLSKAVSFIYGKI